MTALAMRLSLTAACHHADATGHEPVWVDDDAIAGCDVCGWRGTPEPAAFTTEEDQA